VTADLFSRLQAVLAGSYTLDRELGRGGMAQVFLAHDLQHGRKVAIKLFLPEVASFGKGRFLREIRTAANLSHPNILALFDSGEGDGLLYYVMPYVEGESLAQRLEREGQLPIDEAIAITRQVAAALQHAHDRGIVHRDIKPGNILLANGHAFVADFGIAYALEESGGDRLTSTGFSLGTPSYMSPEQIGGAGKIDGRADIYSLGCVLFEMLVGDPPFSGRSAQAVLARHSVERVPSVRAVRDTVTPALEHAVRRALAKSPADRYPTASEFAAALTPEGLSRKVPVERHPGSRRLRVLWMASGGALAIVLIAIAAAKHPWSPSRPGSTALHPDRVAVMPFQTVGGTDTSLVSLAGGLADRAAQQFTGAGGPQAVLPGTLRAALKDAGSKVEALDEADALEAGARVGAGLVLLSELSRAGDRLQLSAVLKRTASGQVVAQASELTRNRDSVVPLLDRVVARILIGAAGEPVDREPALVALDLRVLRDYLAARRFFIRGQFANAADQYRQVLRADPDCALAAVGLASTAEFVNDSIRNVAVERAFALRASLPVADQYLLAALKGPRWPAEPTIPERLKAWRVAASEAPDRLDVFFHLGEALFHDGPWTDDQQVLNDAAGAFQKALELEPRFLPALGHLLDLAASGGDTARVRALGGRYHQIDSLSPLADYYRWRVAVALNDQPARRRVLARLDSLAPAVLERIALVSQVDGVALEDGRRAANARWTRTGLRDLIIFGMFKLREVSLNAGRPQEADSLTRAWAFTRPLRPRNRLSLVVDALYWGADTTLAARLVADQAARVDGPLPGRADDLHYDVCAVNLWRLSRGEHAHVAAGIAALRRVPNALADPQTAYIRVCADILEAELAAAQHRPDALRRLEQLDSLAVTAPPTITWILTAANLTAARLWEQQGNLARAFAATRRRLYITDLDEPRVLVAYSTFLREEGRLAALIGDRQSALRAHRIYLALRTAPEPAVAAEVARVRSALDSLQRAPARN